jgi:hypothetical protein
MKTNALLVTAYQSRNNAVRLSLIVNGELVDENAVTRAVVKLEHVSDPAAIYCLDTQTPAGLIDLLEDATVLRFYPGLIPDVALGEYWVWITVYDGLAPNGLAWGASLDKKGFFYETPALYLKMVRWPICTP